MQPLPHGYTNATSGDGTAVVKRYAGPDAEVRRELERGVLMRLQGLLPVPPVLDAPGAACALSRREVALGFVHGAHGQDLMDAGRAAEVLHGSGRVLARIHDLDVTEILPGSPAASGEVLVHGDFGPNNLLFDPETLQIAAVLDWEWAHSGHRIEDLAWCEWIVRMHHPAQIGALDAFFAGYGDRPSWADRQTAMLVRCGRLVDFCERWEPEGDGVREWQTRLRATAGWTE
jgi:hypothetical protein